MRILIFDIETGPSLAYIWNCWQNNIPINMIADSGELLCWCAKWLNEPKVFSDAVWKSGIINTISSLHNLFEEADAVVAHYGSGFDAKVMNTMFIKYGFHPPSPAKMIDTKKVASGKFKFLSNKLDFIGQYLDEGQKIDTGGFELWLKVLEGDKKAQKKMLEYNAQDVRLLEKVYLRMLPWITTHPNQGLFSEDSPDTPICTNCGSKHVHKKGFAATKTQMYQRFKCVDCGTPLRGRYTKLTKNDNVLVQEV